MADEKNENLFSRLTKLFRSGPTVRRKIKNYKEPSASSAHELFRRNVSDVYASTVSAYGAFDRMSRYSDFSEMESTPEIASALDIYAEESTSQDDKGNVLHIYSENRIVKDLLENLFYDVLNVDFNLPMWTRNLVKYGDFFLFNDISPQYGVINVYPIPISEMEREEGYDPKDPMAVRFRWITKGNSALENWQISHFRLLGNDAFLPYGSSVLESARRIWRQLILIEDAMLVYRIVRAPERRIFYIDVGSVPPEEVENYMQQAQTSLKRNKAVDRTSGKSDLRYNPLSIDDDYFIPVRGGESGTKIDSLPGGVNAAAVEDVVYIQNKLFAALKVPKAYIGYDADIGSKATLAQEDIRFSRTIARIQKVIISELNKIAMIHLYSHGFTDEEMLEFSLALNNPSSVAQLQKLELIKTRFEIAGTAPEGSVDREWIRKNILNLTDEEILRIKGGRKADKIEDAEVEAAKPEETTDEPAADEPAADEPAADEPAADEEGDAESEDLFAGDFKDGTVIGEVDGDLPVKPKLEAQDAFGNRLKRKRRRFSNADAEVPDFLSMTIDKHPQSTTNEPFGHSMTKSMKNEDDIGTSLYDSLLGEVNSTKPRRTPEITSTLRRLGVTINRNNKNGDVLKETSAMLNSTEQKDDSNET